MPQVEIKHLEDASAYKVATLFKQNPFPLYRDTPLADRMKEYMLERARKSGQGTLVALIDGEPVLTGQIHEVSYLSEYWGIRMGNISHMVTDRPDHEVTRLAGRELIFHLLANGHMDFVSVRVPGPSVMLARALEDAGFRYAEGFVNIVGTAGNFREQFRVDGVTIREMKESDLAEISKAYGSMPFPGRFITDGGFDREKAVRLYVHRFEEVYEKKLGQIFVAEMDGAFAGALIALVDKDISNTLGVKTNPLSGMGIIIHPRATRKGVALNLLEHRQGWYKEQGVGHINFGVNFNNIPMLRGVAKLGLKRGSTDMSLHWRKRL